MDPAADVVLIRWPAEADRREQLRGAGRLRVLLVEADAEPPAGGDPLEDWARLPVSEADVRARVRGLQARVATSRPLTPALDGDGVLRLGENWVAIPPVEARLVRALLERYGTVVGREVLVRAGWGDRAPNRNALDVHVLRLRRRLEPLGVAVRTVRSRGHLLEVDRAAVPSGWGQEPVRNA